MTGDRRWIALIAVAGLLFLLPGIFHLPLLDRDEARFARAAVEMLERDSPLVPWFNGEYRFDKPPLTYWLMWPGLMAMGEKEAAVRLPSVLGAVLIGVLIFSLGRKMGMSGKDAGLAAMAWLCCLQVMIHGRMAVADMNLMVFLVLSMRCLWELYEGGYGFRDGVRRACFHGLWIAMGLGFLAKGPLAMVVPLLALLLTGLMEWKWRPEGGRRVPAALPLLLAAMLPAIGLVALWGVPALMETRGLFLQVGIGTHVVERGLESFNNRTHIPGFYYLLVLPFFIAPWAGRLPAIRDSVTSHGRTGMFLAGWVLAPFVIFSFFATQLPHYVLPAYPAILLLMALGIGTAKVGWLSKTLGMLVAGVFLALALAAVWGAVLAREFDPGMVLLLSGMAVLTSAIALGSVLALQKDGGWKAVAVMGVLGAVGFQIAAMGLSRVHVTKRLINDMGGNWMRPAASGYQEPSLVWYGSCEWEMGGVRSETADVQVLRGKRWRLDGKTVKSLLRGEPPAPSREISEEHADWIRGGARKVKGLSIADGCWVELWYFAQE